MDSDGAQVVILHALAHQLAHVVAAWLQVDAVSTIVAVFVHRDRASWCPTAHIAVSPLANPLSGKSLAAVVLGTTLVVNSTMVLAATLEHATMVLDATLPCDFFVVALP